MFSLSGFVFLAIGGLLGFSLGSRVFKYFGIRLIEDVVTVGIILGLAEVDVMLAPNCIGEEMLAADILRRAADIEIRLVQNA